MELFKANKQWSTRPADERFSSLRDLYDATKAYADIAVTSTIPFGQLRVEANGPDVVLLGKSDKQAQLTNWAFGQLAARVDAPASYLRKLPPTLAVQNLNHGIKQREIGSDDQDMAKLLIHSNGSFLVRAITSEKYTRIWNYEIADRLLNLESLGWEPAMPDIRTSDQDFPALYASDHDMFAFLRNRSAIIREPGNDQGLQRGVIVENSEVGASALKLTRFLYREMCGNHIIWGASQIMEIKVCHIGDARQKWSTYAAQIKEYAEESASGDETRIAQAMTIKIGDTKEQVLDNLFGKRALAVSRKALEASFDAVQPDQDGDPLTVWGFVQGMTRHSQTIPFADQRTTLDRAAGRIMEIVF